MIHWRQPQDDTPSIWRAVAAFLVALAMLAIVFFAVRAVAAEPVVAVIASVCLGDDCHEILVTDSSQDQRATMTYCGMMGPPALAEWIGSNWPGYRLAGWKCVRGERRQAT